MSALRAAQITFDYVRETTTPEQAERWSSVAPIAANAAVTAVTGSPAAGQAASAGVTFGNASSDEFKYESGLLMRGVAMNVAADIAAPFILVAMAGYGIGRLFGFFQDD